MNDANTALNILFGTELVLKVLWFGPVIYIRDGWNKMDAFIVVTSILDEVLTSVATGAVNDGCVKLSTEI